MTSVALVPPKPKLLDSATLISFLSGLCGTRLIAVSTEGLSRLSVGGAVRFQDRIFLGYAGKVNPADPGGSLIADVTKPLMGPTETNYDMWVSYQRRLNAQFLLKLQLNIRNIFTEDELVPIRAQPADIYSQYSAFDHYKASDYRIYRIAAPRTISLRATLEF